jgi:recombination protein RecA
MRKINAVAGKAGATIFFTNQTREKVGLVWGEKTTTPGGRALRFYASIRVDVRSVGQEKEGEVVTSMHTKALVKKNKTAPPLRIANFIISFGVGVDRIAGIFDAAVERGIVTKSGAWMNYGEIRLGQGRAKALDLLREDAAMLAEIEAKLRAEPVDKKAKKAKTEDDEEPVEDAEEAPAPKKARGRKPIMTAEEVPESEDGGTTVDDV